MMIEDILLRLDAVRSRGMGKWIALCPAHSDTSPSLSIREGDRGILLHCFAGCPVEAIAAAVGLQVADLFSDARNPRGRSPHSGAPRIDRIAVAFRYELAGLDRRLRAEQIMATAKTLDVSSLSDAELDLAMSHVGGAYRDIGRAKLFEHVSDTLRERDCIERISHERQARTA